MSVIRFCREWRRREPGRLDHELGYGMHDALVMRGIAEWVDKDPLATVSAISEPVAVTSEPESNRDRRRRFSQKES